MDWLAVKKFDDGMVVGIRPRTEPSGDLMICSLSNWEKYIQLDQDGRNQLFDGQPEWFVTERDDIPALIGLLQEAYESTQT